MTGALRPMKKTIVATFLFCLAPCAVFAQDDPPPPFSRTTTPQAIGTQATQTSFAQAIEDLPVMPGMQIVEDKDMLILFGDKRIAQATLEGPVDIDQVYYFYASVLPELGWKKLTPKIYERAGERLSMKPNSANPQGLTRVRFEVEPLK